MDIFNDYAYYYNMFYREKDYACESEYINRLIQTYNSNAGEILNLGCGTGRHDEALAQYGYKIHGVDISCSMIDEALKNIDNKCITFEVGDIRTYKTQKQYDVVTSLFHVMSYQVSDEDLKAAFHTAYNALVPGGIFIFDCWYGPGVLTDLPTTRVKEAEDEKNKIIRLAQPIMQAMKNSVDVKYDIMIINKQEKTVTEIQETHTMRYLFNPEVNQLFTKTGFKINKCFKFNTMEQPDYNTWYAYFIGVK